MGQPNPLGFLNDKALAFRGTRHSASECRSQHGIRHIRCAGTGCRHGTWPAAAIVPPGCCFALERRSLLRPLGPSQPELYLARWAGDRDHAATVLHAAEILGAGLRRQRFRVAPVLRCGLGRHDPAGIPARARNGQHSGGADRRAALRAGADADRLCAGSPGLCPGAIVLRHRAVRPAALHSRRAGRAAAAGDGRAGGVRRRRGAADLCACHIGVHRRGAQRLRRAAAARAWPAGPAALHPGECGGGVAVGAATLRHPAAGRTLRSRMDPAAGSDRPAQPGSTTCSSTR